MSFLIFSRHVIVLRELLSNSRYYNNMGRKYGLERYEDITLLPAEERRSRVHKNKAVLEAERQAKEAVAQSEYIAESNRLEAKHARERAAQYESYANAIDVKQEDLAIPSLETNQLVNDVWKFIQAELNTPPPFLHSIRRNGAKIDERQSSRYSPICRLHSSMPRKHRRKISSAWDILYTTRQ